MKKSDLIELASLGMRHKLRAIERQLAGMWKLFPDLFLSATAPQLLRPEPRGASTNGQWPDITVRHVEDDDDDDDVPSPPRTIKKSGKKRTAKKAIKTTTGTPIDLNAYQKIYAFIAEHPGAALSDVARGMKVHPANLRQKLLRGVDRGFFMRQDDGGFHAKAAPIE